MTAALLPLGLAACQVAEGGRQATDAPPSHAARQAAAAPDRPAAMATGRRPAGDMQGGTIVMEETLALLKSDDPHERSEAVYELDADGDAAGVLVALVRDDPDPGVRLAAVTQLGTGEGAQVVDGLVRALSDADSAVVQEAIDGLSHTADARVIPDLFALLQHPDPDVRERAQEALESLQGE